MKLCILNIFRKYEPNKYITIDDKDPAWMNKIIKSKIKGKNALCKKYVQNGRFESDFVFLENLIIELNELTSSAKSLYYENLVKKLKKLKICDKPFSKPLILLFQNSAKLYYFLDIWKKSNIIPVHKRNDKQLVENYPPISLFSYPSCETFLIK